MGKPTELMQLLKTGNSDAARKLITKMKKSGKYRAAIEIQTISSASASKMDCFGYLHMCV